VDVYDQALDTEEGDAAARAGGNTAERAIQPATAPAGRGEGSTEYDSVPLDAPPRPDRGLQPAVLEAGYGGSDSVLNPTGTRARSNTEWSRDAATRGGERPNTGPAKGRGINRTERRGSLGGFGGTDANA